MAKPNIKTDEMVDEIIERVSVGETLTAICKDDHLPTIRSLMRWLAKDDKLDDRMHRARIRGTLIQADEAVDAQRSVINGTAKVEAKQLQAVVTAANNMGHQANTKLSKIDTRYKDKQEIAHTGPLVLGWDEPQQVEHDKPLDDEVLNAITSEAVAN